MHNIHYVRMLRFDGSQRGPFFANLQDIILITGFLFNFTVKLFKNIFYIFITYGI